MTTPLSTSRRPSWPFSASSAVDLDGIHQSAEEVRDLALCVPRLVVLQAPGVALQQQRRRTGEFDLLGDRELAGQQLAGQPVLLPVQHEACARLEDVGALAEQTRVLEHLRAPAPGHQDDLDACAQTRLNRAHAVDRHRPLTVVQQ